GPYPPPRSPGRWAGRLPDRSGEARLAAGSQLEGLHRLPEVVAVVDHHAGVVDLDVALEPGRRVPVHARADPLIGLSEGLDGHGGETDPAGFEVGPLPHLEVGAADRQRVRSEEHTSA